MKIKYLILVCSILCLLLSPASVLAESENPPPKKTEEPSTDAQQAEPIQTEPKSPTLNPDYTPPPPPEKDKNDTNSRSTSGRDVSIEDTINIGVESGITEKESDVAYGDGVYAIAYEKDGAIIVASLFKSGSSYIIYRDTIYDGDNSSHYPAIAYEAESGLFVVTWQYDFNGDGTDYDVYARLLDPNSGPVGNYFSVSEELDQETYPDVACKQSYSKCMVVFAQEDTNINIYGRYLGVGSSGISAPSMLPLKSRILLVMKNRPILPGRFLRKPTQSPIPGPMALPCRSVPYFMTNGKETSTQPSWKMKLTLFMLLLEIPGIPTDIISMRPG